MFFARSFSLRVRSVKDASASTAIEVMATGWTCQASSEPSSRGLTAYPTLARLRLLNSSVLTMMLAPRGRSRRFALSAAGFIATSTSGASPGVSTSWSAKCSWKLETPGSVPWGARISAGKFGRVDRSLPSRAVSDVKRSPVSCMPSPESPAKRMTTRSSFWTSLVLIALRRPRVVAASAVIWWRFRAPLSGAPDDSMLVRAGTTLWEAATSWTPASPDWPRLVLRSCLPAVGACPSGCSGALRRALETASVHRPHRPGRQRTATSPPPIPDPSTLG